jgi:N-formylglutamate deformylase
MTPVVVTSGSSPVILGMPHGGTFVPDDIRAQLNHNGLLLADTDWHIEKLYQDLLPNVTVVTANFHRYVIDANRDPEGQSLYPGQNTTGLCPLTDFDGVTIYKEGCEPSAAEIARRVAEFHAPYHAALAAEIARVKNLHGYAIVYDCHSIRSRIPFLFDGDLPALNVGTDGGKTCDQQIEQMVHQACTASAFSNVLNGRFRGGWTTRHYGKPHTGIHAIQMEIAQSAYLTEEHAPWTYDVAKAESLRITLRHILVSLADMKGLRR